MNESSDDLLAAMTPVVEEFERLGVTYYVGGSAVSSNYGVARSTLDIDLVADLLQEHVIPLVEGLKAEYYVDAHMISEAIARKSCFNLIHMRTSFKVDVFVVKNRLYDRVALQRIREDSLDQERLARRHRLEQAGMVPAGRRGLRATVGRRARRVEGAGRRPGPLVSRKVGRRAGSRRSAEKGREGSGRLSRRR